MNQLNINSKWVLRAQALYLLFFFSLLIFNLVWNFSKSILLSISIPVISYFVFFVLFEVYLIFWYREFKYDLTDSCLKIERGVIWKVYVTIPFERVQNVNISRGVWARLFGFSSVSIETAGSNFYSGGNRHAEGYLPGVDISEAERIRSEIMSKISSKSDI